MLWRPSPHLPCSRRAPRWHPEPPGGAPNVLLVLIDDAGFGNPSTFGPAQRQAAIARQRNLLEAAVNTALPAPFASVASRADREGLG